MKTIQTKIESVLFNAEIANINVTGLALSLLATGFTISLLFTLFH